MLAICFKVLLTIILSGFLIIPISLLCIIDKIDWDDVDVDNIKTGFRGKFFFYVIEYDARLVLLSFILIFPLGLIWLLIKMWN